MDRVVGFINVEDTFEALMALQRSELEQADQKTIGQKGGPSCEKGKRGAPNARRNG